MKTTKTVKLSKNEILRQYIIESIDNSGYTDQVLTTDREKLQFLIDTFKQEYGWAIKEYKTVHNTLVNWMQGLPTSFTVHFEYYHIIQFGIRYGFLTKNSPSKIVDKFCQTWWNRVAVQVLRLCRKHEININL